MKRRHALHPDSSGFSLIELVIAIVILGLLGITGGKMISNSVYTTQMITQNHLAYSKARFAMNRISSDIREIQFINNAPNFTSTWQSPPVSSIAFVKTNLSDSVQPTTTVSFSYSGSTLTMQLDSGTAAILVDDLSNFSLSFLQYDDTSPTGTKPADSWLTTRFVVISMTIAPVDAPAQTLVNTVALRNY